MKNENDDKIIEVFNYCILYAKYFVYTGKINNNNICLSDYKANLKIRLEIEKHIASSQNKIVDFELTWNLLFIAH